MSRRLIEHRLLALVERRFAVYNTPPNHGVIDQFLEELNAEYSINRKPPTPGFNGNYSLSLWSRNHDDRLLLVVGHTPSGPFSHGLPGTVEYADIPGSSVRNITSWANSGNCKSERMDEDRWRRLHRYEGTVTNGTIPPHIRWSPARTSGTPPSAPATFVRLDV